MTAAARRWAAEWRRLSKFCFIDFMVTKNHLFVSPRVPTDYYGGSIKDFSGFEVGEVSCKHRSKSGVIVMGCIIKSNSMSVVELGRSMSNGADSSAEQAKARLMSDLEKQRKDGFKQGPKTNTLVGKPRVLGEFRGTDDIEFNILGQDEPNVLRRELETSGVKDGILADVLSGNTEQKRRLKGVQNPRLVRTLRQKFGRGG